jgi:flavodoxin
MKTNYFFMAIIALLFTTNTNTKAQTSLAGKKIVVAYYSHSGNTREMAALIANATGGDIFEIVPAKSYPSDYNAVVEQAKKEINENYRPPLKGKLENIADYDVIFIGSPNWWSTIAPPIATFLSQHDLSGKTVIPFCTHGSGGQANLFKDIAKLCPDATVLAGLPVRGSSVKSSNDDVLKWLRKIGVVK